MNEQEFKTGKAKSKGKGEKALRDFHIYMPPKYDIYIKEGDDINALDLPEGLLQNLKTEKVMKG